MKFLGNLLWFVLGGFESGLCWLLAGIFWCLTIVGIPIGRQCFKFVGLSFFPFGKEVCTGGGTISFLANLFWIVFSGIPLAAVNAALGIFWCLTIVGIPFGKQFFKLAKLSLTPFGTEVK